MRRTAIALVTCFGLLVAACGGDDAAAADAAVPAPDGPYPDRPYGLNVPPGYDPATPAPLLIMLHGFGANAFVDNIILHTSELADSEGFLYAYPEGTTNSTGMQFWNATDACCDNDNSGVDDVAYLTWIIDDVSSRYNVDPKRIFLVGHSNGGYMAHRMACDRADRIAAIVSLAGATWKDQANCQPSAPVAVLQVHGDADGTVVYDGTAFSPGAVETTADWATLNGCTGALALDPTRLDLEQDLAGAESHVERHGGCPGGAAELWTIEGGGHIPTFGAGWAPAIAQFLMAHPKP